MKSNLRRSLQIAVLAGSVAGLSCDHSPASPDHWGRSVARETFSFDIPTAGRTTLSLEGISGTVFLTGSSQAASVLITGERRVESRLEGDAEERLRELEVRVAELGNEIRVETVQPSDSNGRNYVVDYRITLPRDFEVHVSNISGDVELSGTQGNAFVSVVSGRIDSQITVPVQGIIDMATVSGGIQLEIPRDTSAELSANVVSGTISISNLTLRDELHTPVSLQGTLGDGQGLISLRVTSGNVRVQGF